MQTNEHNSFSYSYSAKEQEEIKNIRKKYLPQEEDDLERLRRLDFSVNRKAAVGAYIWGIIGTLVMGFGMSLCLVWAGNWFVPGIFIGVVGIGLILLAYPFYQRTLTKQREKIVPEILRLTDELLK